MVRFAGRRAAPLSSRPRPGHPTRAISGKPALVEAVAKLQDQPLGAAGIVSPKPANPVELPEKDKTGQNWILQVPEHRAIIVRARIASQAD